MRRLRIQDRPALFAVLLGDQPIVISALQPADVQCVVKRDHSGLRGGHTGYSSEPNAVVRSPSRATNGWQRDRLRGNAIPWHTSRTRELTRSHARSLLSMLRLNSAGSYSRPCIACGRPIDTRSARLTRNASVSSSNSCTNRRSSRHRDIVTRDRLYNWQSRVDSASALAVLGNQLSSL